MFVLEKKKRVRRIRGGGDGRECRIKSEVVKLSIRRGPLLELKGWVICHVHIMLTKLYKEIKIFSLFLFLSLTHFFFFLSQHVISHLLFGW